MVSKFKKIESDDVYICACIIVLYSLMQIKCIYFYKCNINLLSILHIFYMFIDVACKFN